MTAETIIPGLTQPESNLPANKELFKELGHLTLADFSEEELRELEEELFMHHPDLDESRLAGLEDEPGDVYEMEELYGHTAPIDREQN